VHFFTTVSAFAITLLASLCKVLSNSQITSDLTGDDGAQCLAKSHHQTTIIKK